MRRGHPASAMLNLYPSVASRDFKSALHEREKLGIDDVGVCRTHAVWEPGVDLESPLSEEFRGERRGISDRDDLVVVACMTRVGTSIFFRFFGKARLREGFYAIVMCFRAADHGLAPPVLDHALQHLRARPVIAVEGTAR